MAKPDLACVLESLSESISHQTRVLHEIWEQIKNDKQTELLRAIHKLEEKIMSAISDFAAKQNAFNDRQDAALTAVQDDVKTLTDKITELQNSPGTITPEDQASLDAIQSRAEAITTKLEALDALTPPKPPVS